jgi:hypothetical protein
MELNTQKIEMFCFAFQIIQNAKKNTFSCRVFCADSEYMLDVAYGPILAEKV